MHRSVRWALALLLSGCGARTGTDILDYRSEDAAAGGGGAAGLGDGGRGVAGSSAGGRGSGGRGSGGRGGVPGAAGSGAIGGTGPSCAGGTRCGGACVDLSSDNGNCGRCGVACPSGNACSDGTCVSPSCDRGLTDCGGLWGCVDLKTNPITCGSCSTSCGAEACVDGQCVCASDLDRVFCNGQCVDLLIDSNNCGGCGLLCSGGTYCVDGNCLALPCEPPATYCDNLGICVNLSNNAVACGDCFNNCIGFGGSCRNGVCAPGR